MVRVVEARYRVSPAPAGCSSRPLPGGFRISEVWVGGLQDRYPRRIGTGPISLRHRSASLQHRKCPRIGPQAVGLVECGDRVSDRAAVGASSAASVAIRHSLRAREERHAKPAAGDDLPRGSGRITRGTTHPLRLVLHAELTSVVRLQIRTLLDRLDRTLAKDDGRRR